VNTFEIVTFGVTFGALAACLTPYFRVGHVLAELGRQGQIWFDRPEDHAIDEQPSEDAVDAPIPWRPLRGRR
jgi:hypothetical protein